VAVREALSYTWLAACDNCGSTRWRVYGAAADTGRVHPVQCRCRNCDLVFANPRLTPESLAQLYRRYYSEYAPDQQSAEIVERYDAAARTLLGEIRRSTSTGVLLDVGCGTGAFMSRARVAGFDVHGVELSEEGVALARSQFGLETVTHGTLEGAGYPAAEFDVVVAWHLIEHVSDVGAFVDEVCRVLKPGGIAVIGTESHRYPINAWARGLRFATGRVPRPVTSDLHTYVFSPKALANCFTRRGLSTIHLQGYDELTAAQRTALLGGRRAVAYAGAAAARITRTGPYLLASFRRP
jgi:2-polyprenyl-3-methyl-5-hydroxy-6-metoxy-1,4-benzoquinol methylase